MEDWRLGAANSKCRTLPGRQNITSLDHDTIMFNKFLLSIIIVFFIVKWGLGSFGPIGLIWAIGCIWLGPFGCEQLAEITWLSI